MGIRSLPLAACVLASALLFCPSRSSAAVEPNEAGLQTPLITAQPGSAEVHSNTSSASLARAAVTDTFDVYGGPDSSSGKFQDAAGRLPDWQGWFGVDLTQESLYWQVSTYKAENLNDNGPGNHAYWCGQSAEQQPGWNAAPGYGNGWFAPIVVEVPVSDPSAGQTVDLDFFFNHDTEPGYDFVGADYDSAGQWKRIYFVSGYNRPNHNDPFVPPPGVRFSEVADPIVYGGNDYSTDDTIRIRVFAASDGAWSDQDGLWPTDGAIQMDDVTLTTSEGTLTEDFEGPGPYLFEPVLAPFAGDFSEVYAQAADIDPCRGNGSPLVAFVDYGQEVRNGPNPDGVTSTGGSFDPQWTYGPGGAVVNFTGGLSFGQVDLANQVWSPPIEWDLPGADDDGFAVRGAIFGFDAWTHLPLVNGMFMQWHIRSRGADQNWSSWEDRSFVYQGTDPPRWVAYDFDVTDLLVDDVQQVQFALGLVDLSDIYGFPGLNATPAPYFDNVRLKKYEIGGPSMVSRTIDLANDAFPASETLDLSPAGKGGMDVRFDMAQDLSPVNYRIDPGDSVTVDVESVLPGVGVVDVRMFWELRKNPFFEDVLRSAPAGPTDVNVDTSDPDSWSGEVIGQHPTVGGYPQEYRYFFDLPDVDFLYPGDQIHYYFAATDDDGRISTLPADTSGFGAWDANGVSSYDRRFTMRALPTVHDALGDVNRILLINDAGHIEGEDEWRLALRENGYFEWLDYDVYTVKGPTSFVNNGIGSTQGHGASAAQLSPYRSILYTCENLPTNLLANGIAGSESDSSDDIAVLTAWHGEPGPRNIAYFGENLVSELSGGASADQLYLSSIMGASLVSSDVSEAVGVSSPIVAPEVSTPWFNAEFVAYGGCPFPASVDQIQPSASAVAGHRFLDSSLAPVLTAAASVLYARDVEGATKIDVTFPYGFSSIRTPLGGAGAKRAILLGEVLDLFGETRVVLDVPEAREPRELGMTVAPNPFNPTTRIVLRIPAAGRVVVEAYDLRGQRVRTLMARSMEAGVTTIAWDGRDDRGRSLASGIYLVQVHGENASVSKKVALIK